MYRVFFSLPACGALFPTMEFIYLFCRWAKHAYLKGQISIIITAFSFASCIENKSINGLLIEMTLTTS